jgi:hypothetical protein
VASAVSASPAADHDAYVCTSTNTSSSTDSVPRAR